MSVFRRRAEACIEDVGECGAIGVACGWLTFKAAQRRASLIRVHAERPSIAGIVGEWGFDGNRGYP
jgi:hypothetical protein